MTTEAQLASEVAAWLCGHEGAKAIVVERTQSSNPSGDVLRARYIVGCSHCGEMVGWLSVQGLHGSKLLLFENGDEILGRTLANLKAQLAVVHAAGTPHFVHKKKQGVTDGLNYRPLKPPDVTCPRCLEWIEQGRPMVVRD